jgi:hypothetical protein
MPLKVRSMVGLIPLFAVETLEPELLSQAAGLQARLEWFIEHRPDLARLVSHGRSPGPAARRLLSLVRGPDRSCERVLRRMLDERSSCPTTACARCRASIAITLR